MNIYCLRSTVKEDKLLWIACEKTCRSKLVLEGNVCVNLIIYT